MALVDRATYDAIYPFPFVNEESAGDFDGSDTFDLGDIVGFNSLFAGPASAQAIPEPTTLSLAFVLLLSIAIRRRRRV